MKLKAYDVAIVCEDVNNYLKIIDKWYGGKDYFTYLPKFGDLESNPNWREMYLYGDIIYNLIRVDCNRKSLEDFTKDEKVIDERYFCCEIQGGVAGAIFQDNISLKGYDLNYLMCLHRQIGWDVEGELPC